MLSSTRSVISPLPACNEDNITTGPVTVPPLKGRKLLFTYSYFG